MDIPYFDGCGSFQVKGPNTEALRTRCRIPIWWFQDHVELDWPLVLLAVSAGCLPPREVLYFALRELDEDSPESVLGLALIAFEADADIVCEEKYVTDIASHIEEDQWSLAFEKLFYVAACWVYFDCVDEYTPFKYDLSIDLFDLWDSLGRPGVGECLFECDGAEEGRPNASSASLEIPWSEDCEPLWSRFVDTGKALYRPKDAHEAIASDSAAHWNASDGLPFIVPSSLIAEPMNFLIAGNDPVMDQMRRQYAASAIAKETISGEGFVVEFAIPSDVAPLTGFKTTFAIGDVSADSDGGSVGFVVTVKDGYLHTFEAYMLTFTLDGRGWPPSGSSFDDVYYRLYTHELSERDWESIRPAWQRAESADAASIDGGHLCDACSAGDSADTTWLGRKGVDYGRATYGAGAAIVAIGILLFVIDCLSA